MEYFPFIHGEIGSPTTISEVHRVSNKLKTKRFLGLYAYATQSGVALFDMAMGASFWEDVSSQWVFGIDYGRTQPQALRALASRANAEVRIYDGEWVVNQNGFVPRRDFHAKLCIQFDAKNRDVGMVFGSGNFSANGLAKSVEAGASVCTAGHAEYVNNLESACETAWGVWERAVPLDDIYDTYEERWRAAFSRSPEGVTEIGEEYRSAKVFWIEAGYVTRNRGANKPGNQIDFPRGMSKMFGFDPPDDMPANTIIGNLTFETAVGDLVSNNLRLGNNMMEKVSLPIPETHGFDIYDGKVLLFERVGGRFFMSALEASDFDAAFGGRSSQVQVMASGRRYGVIV